MMMDNSTKKDEGHEEGKKNFVLFVVNRIRKNHRQLT